MLTIRMQRTGRSGHAQYRVIVQDSRFTPTSGRVVAYLGSYNPHTKEATIDSEKTSSYLSNGAQPSERVARLLKAQGVKMPGWVKEPVKKEGSIRNTEKLRRNRPPEQAAEAPKVEEAPVEVVPESPADNEQETVETPAEETTPEVQPESPAAPAEESETAAEPEVTETEASADKTDKDK